jgi:hypothetical protein
MRALRKLILTTVLAAGFSIPAAAATVGGILSGPNDASGADRQLHYTNDVTKDNFLAPTGPNGEFTADLPPGIYSLRKENGAVLLSGIIVDYDTTELRLGQVRDTPFKLVNIFQYQRVVPVIIHSPAPGTSYLTSQQFGIASAMPYVPPSALRPVEPWHAAPLPGMSAPGTSVSPRIPETTPSIQEAPPPY